MLQVNRCFSSGSCSMIFCRTRPVTQRVGMDQCQVIIQAQLQNQNQWFSSVFGPLVQTCFVESVGFIQAILVGIIQISRSYSFFSLSFQNQQLVPDGSARSLITATVGPRVLTRLDDGSGGTSPERVAALWTEAGIRNSQQILQVGPDPVLLDYNRI